MPTDPARIELILSEYRTENSQDPAVKVKHLSSEEVTLNTFLIDQADAATLADEILDLKKEDRYTWNLKLSTRWRFNLELGKTYTITHPRFGLSSGKNFILRGIKWGSNSPIVEAIFFGPE